MSCSADGYSHYVGYVSTDLDFEFSCVLKILMTEIEGLGDGAWAMTLQLPSFGPEIQSTARMFDGMGRRPLELRTILHRSRGVLELSFAQLKILDL